MPNFIDIEETFCGWTELCTSKLKISHVTLTVRWFVIRRQSIDLQNLTILAIVCHMTVTTPFLMLT